MVEGIQGGINKVLNADAGAAACHDGAAVAVDSALDHYVGKAEQAPLDPRRNTHTGNGNKAVPVRPYLLPGKAQRAVAAAQITQHQPSADKLGNDGGQGNARHVHFKHDDKNQIQHQIQYAADRQVHQGPAGVPLGTEGRCTVVIAHDEGRSAEVDPQVQKGQRIGVGRGLHPPQNGRCGGKAKAAQKSPAHNGHKHGGMQRLGDLLFVEALTKKPRNDHIHAHGHTDQEVGKEVHDGGGRPHGCQAGMAGKAAYHHDVHSVEKELQNIGRHKRNGKKEDLSENRTVYHINGTFHRVTPFCVTTRR